MRVTGFLPGTASPATIMLGFIRTIKTIWVLLGISTVLSDILLLRCFLSGAAVLVFASRNFFGLRRWRSMGHVSFVYLDDGLDSVPDNCSAQASSIIQRIDLGSCGFVVNEDN